MGLARRTLEIIRYNAEHHRCPICESIYLKTIMRPRDRLTQEEVDHIEMIMEALRSEN